MLVRSVIEPKKNILEKRFQNNEYFPKIFILTLSWRRPLSYRNQSTDRVKLILLRSKALLSSDYFFINNFKTISGYMNFSRNSMRTAAPTKFWFCCLNGFEALCMLDSDLECDTVLNSNNSNNTRNIALFCFVI